MTRGVVVCVLAGLFACGPSMRMIHESDTYYERCYAADVNPDVSIDLRRQCWSLWLEHYTPGQPPDRVAYARARESELAAGISAPPLPSRTSAGAPQPTTATEDGGAPSDPASSTPPAAGTPDAGVHGDSDSGVGPSPELADGSNTGAPRPDSPAVRAAYRSPPPTSATTACDPVCREGWDACIPRCDDRTRACRAACQAQYRSCQAGCY